jgi:valyl-tRNA synthetase
MTELAKSFIAKEHEEGIRTAWEKSGLFNPDNLTRVDKGSYTIILPPPNVTDRLHLGHASMLAIEDLLIRFHRMNGYKTLWLPGTDHAAIATQTVVEKKIYKESGKTRHDLGREEFLRQVNQFALETQTTIIGQIKSFGASLDWSRLAFTLDEPRQKAVKRMFVEMYEAGALYRGERIVNWCPHCQSTLADDEVEYQTQKTILYTFKY